MTTWHLQNVDAWRELAAPVLAGTGKRTPRWLELGSYSGGSAAWVLDNLLPSAAGMTCVDTWGDAAVEREFDQTVERFGGRVTKLKGSTADVLPSLRGLPRYDVIYIDADHDASAVLRDAVYAWPLLNVGGLLMFDDYRWNHPPHRVRQLAPCVGIDAFIAAFQLQIAVLHKGSQVIAQKLRLHNNSR